MKSLVLSTAAFVLLVSTSCITINASHKRARGPIEERTITLNEAATALAISNGINVVVDNTLAANEVSITTHSDIINDIKVEVKDSSLNISRTSCKLHAETLIVRVPTFEYDTLALSGGSDLYWDACAVPSLSIAISSGADAKIKGNCNKLTVAASAGADVDCEDLYAEDVNVAASAGADVAVYASKSITVVASSGSDVSYAGNPAVKQITTSSGADVEIAD